MDNMLAEKLAESYETRRSATFPPERISDDWLAVEPEIAELILQVPPLLDCVEQLIDSPIPLAAKVYYGNVYAYVFNPFDLFPEEEFGFYSYFDNFIVLLKGLKRFDYLQDRLTHHHPFVEGLAERFGRLAEKLNPDYLRPIDRYLAALEQISQTIVEAGVYHRD